MIMGIPIIVLYGQLMLGLINGAFYAMLSLGLAVIFGLLNIINFAHGVQYMLGALIAWYGLSTLGMNYWTALLVAPVCVGLFGIVLERLVISRISKLDHLYGFLLTFGLAIMIESFFRNIVGSSGLPYATPSQLTGTIFIGKVPVPIYRLWALAACLVVCVTVWLVIERTRLGATLRAATENPALSMALGINVPVLVTLTYGFGAALAALTGVLAAPIYTITPGMGSDLLIVVFAVVVIGGMGSIIGAAYTGLALGVIEGLTKAIYPQAANTIIFMMMVLLLLVKPSGLFGRAGR